jgi:hypothetical protein
MFFSNFSQGIADLFHWKISNASVRQVLLTRFPIKQAPQRQLKVKGIFKLHGNKEAFRTPTKRLSQDASSSIQTMELRGDFDWHTVALASRKAA